MKKGNGLKLLGVLGAGLGFAATLLSGYVSEKQMDKTVEEKVSKALAEFNK